MSANLLEVGLFTASSYLTLPTQTIVGGVAVDTTISETYEDTLEATEHPVEAGAQITDHSYKRPMQCILRCGWSDSSFNALSGIATNLVNSITGASSQTTASFTGGSMAASDYVAGVYSQLLELQESRQTFELTTGLRAYDTMLLMSLRVQRDHTNRYALFVEAVCKQIIVVSTQTTTLPPQSNQANPQNTAEVTNAGSQQLQSGSPAPGGSFPPNQWVDNSTADQEGTL